MFDDDVLLLSFPTRDSAPNIDQVSYRQVSRLPYSRLDECKILEGISFSYTTIEVDCYFFKNPRLWRVIGDWRCDEMRNRWGPEHDRIMRQSTWRVADAEEEDVSSRADRIGVDKSPATNHVSSLYSIEKQNDVNHWRQSPSTRSQPHLYCIVRSNNQWLSWLYRLLI